MDIMTNGQLIYYSGIGSMAFGVIFLIIMIVLSGFKKKKMEQENEIQEKNDKKLCGDFAMNATVIFSESMSKTVEIDSHSKKTVLLENSEEDKTLLLDENDKTELLDEDDKTLLLDENDM